MKHPDDEGFERLLDASSLGAPHITTAHNTPIPPHVQARLTAAARVPRETPPRKQTMTSWTNEDLNEMHRLRTQERQAQEELIANWNNAKVGDAEETRTYLIEYRIADSPVWRPAAPFFEPLRLRLDETTDAHEAHAVAIAIMEGSHPVSKTDKPGAYAIDGVRVVERWAGVRIISQLGTDVPRETPTED